MRWTTWLSWLVVGLFVATFVAVGGLAVAAPPPAPKVSTFAPAEDLVNQVAEYVDDIEKSAANEQEYKDGEGRIVKESNTLILIALALGLHDTDNKYKAHAPALLQAARGLAAAKDYAATKQAIAAVRTALEGKASDAAELKWEKMASLQELMKHVPLINTKMKRYLKGSRFKTNAKDTAGHSAVLAVIAQGAMADTAEAKDEDQIKQWYNFCVQMRDAAAAVNSGIHGGNEAATAEAMKKLAQSCDDCHAVFHKEQLGKEESGQ